MKEPIAFSSISPILTSDIQIVSCFSIFTDRLTDEVSNFVLKIALNKTKADSESCEFPVYIPAKNNFHNSEHQELLKQFRTGAPFVPVNCHNLQVYRYPHNNHYKYFGYADSFTVIDYSLIMEDK